MHIKKPFAVFTYKMIMWLTPVVVARRPVIIADMDNFPCISHLVQVSVDRRFTDSGVGLDDIIIDLLSRRMAVKLDKRTENELPLNCIPPCTHVI